MCGGESGRVLICTPKLRSAEATAFAITPPVGMIPPSPRPFAPEGLFGDGWSWVVTARMLGKSVASGTR